MTVGMPTPSMGTAGDLSAQEEFLDSRQTADNVIYRAQAKIGVSRVRSNHQQFLGVLIRFAHLFQTVELLLIDQIGLETSSGAAELSATTDALLVLRRNL